MKLINGLKNGTAITKVCLTLILILSPVTFIAGILGLLMKSVPAAIVAFVCLCADIYLIAHLQTIKRRQREEEEKKNRVPLFSAEREPILKDKNESEKSAPVIPKTVQGKKKKKVVENWREEDGIRPESTASKTVISGRDEDDWGLGQVDTGFEQADQISMQEELKPDGRISDIGEFPDDNFEEEVDSEDEIANIDEKEFQKTLKKLGVTADAFPVLIDIWRVQRIRQCPAYMWISGSDMKIATLSDPPKKFKLPAESFKHVNHVSKVSANPREDYRNITRSIPFRREFSSLIPAYEKQGVSNNFRYYKNQYVIGNDFALTPASAGELKKRIDFDLTLMNSAINNGSYNHYFKDAYKNKIMWGDGVITKHEYQEFMKRLLSELSCDKSFGDRAFNDAIAEMLRAKLINDDYANYFSGMRNARLDGSDF